MVRITFAATLALAITVMARPSPATPDPSGVKNIGNGAGIQFIGGECLSSADCASTCCAINANLGGICSGIGAQFQNGKQGCGFGDGGAALPAPPADNNAGGNNAGAIDTSIPGSQSVGLGNGAQFITGQCFSDADCASGCCSGAGNLATCASPNVGKTCGFVQ